MARLLGPDMGSRSVFLPNGRPAAGKTGVVYADAAGTILANIAAYQPGSPSVPGAVISGSIVTVDSAGLLPLFWFPDGVDRLWITVNDGPLVPIDADYNARLDAVAGDLGPVANPRRWPQMTVLSDMSSGWSATGAASSNLADASDAAIGSTSVSIASNTTASLSAAVRTISVTDLTGKGLVVWVKVDSGPITDVVMVPVYISSDGGASYYRAAHYINNNKYPLKVGEWCPLQISNAQFRREVTGAPNIAAINWVRVGLFPASGKSVPWRVGGVATYDDTSTKWPNGVVSLTFDDGPDSTWTYARPKMAARGWAGTLFPIHSVIGTAGRLTLDQVKKLHSVYGWEIGAHASTNAAHVDYAAQTTEWIANELRTMRRWQRDNGLPSASFAYPSGTFSADAAATVSTFFTSARSTADTIDPIAPIHPMGAGSVVCSASLTLAQAQAAVDAAAAGKGWLRITFHGLVTSGATGNDWLVSDFNALMDYIATKSLAVAPIGSV